MARVDLDELQKKVDVKAVLNSLNVEYTTRREGTEIVTHCTNPDHNDESPSLHMNARNDQYNGVFVCKPCGHKGNIFTFVKDILKVDFGPALGHIIKVMGGEVSLENGDETMRDRIEALQASIAESNDYEPHPIELYGVDFFPNQRVWRRDHIGDQYLAKRGVHPQIAYDLGLGYSEFFTFDGMKVPYAIIIPVFYKGILCTWMSRSVYTKDKLYQKNAPTRSFTYNIDSVIPDLPTIVVEGCFDVYSVLTALFIAGIEMNVVGVWSNNPTPEHIEMLKAIGGELILMPDRDSKYGMRMCDLIGDALVHECELSLALVPDGNDPGESTYFDIVQAVNERQSWSAHISKNLLLHGERYTFSA